MTSFIQRSARSCRLPLLSMAAAAVLASSAAAADQVPPRPGYVVVISRQTAARPEWKRVAEALVAKHGASLIQYDKRVDEALPALRRTRPRYGCFVATRDEATRQHVADLHRLARRIDDDPYTDLLWGILTGYDAEAALRIARTDKPLTVERVASGTEVALEMCPEGIWYCELQQNRMVRKRPGGEPAEEKGPDDTTRALADTLNNYQAQLFVTSGHATERDWQIGYRYRNGSFRSKGGRLFGLDTEGKRTEIESPEPKVYMPIGNCLMGHIDGPDAMALAWMNSAGVRQMLGYTVSTWYGYGGWGCLDYFVEQPGRYTFTEAFFANHLALLHRLETEFPELARLDPAPGKTSGRGDGAGLLFDRDTVAFYGDPAWEARMTAAPCAWEQELSVEGNTYKLTITPRRGEKTFEPINTNGAQRGWRPIVAFLPHRIGPATVTRGSDLDPLVADDFVLIPNPRKCDPDREYEVEFRAEPVR